MDTLEMVAIVMVWKEKGRRRKGITRGQNKGKHQKWWQSLWCGKRKGRDGRGSLGGKKKGNIRNGGNCYGEERERLEMEGDH
jgi:hypothetical protein